MTKGATFYFSAFMISFFICPWGCRSHDKSSSAISAYSEKHRPLFHFSPDSMWMNDPNGMVYYKGEYHLFYQYYPHGNVWGPMHWGHAISNDMVHWQHLPIALYPDSLGYIFSGSAVIDWQNTSGFGSKQKPPMVAIFTHHDVQVERSGGQDFQHQSIAYSLDKGRSWTKYYGNPVIKNPGIRDFRDPKVIWYEKGSMWIMVFAAGDRVMFYTSPDLKNWKKESEFGTETGAHGGVWECPDLFPLEFENEEKWVLLVSINPGGPNGGSATQYFVGEFDGTVFHNENPGTDPLWLDYGKDNYAGVTWSDIPAEDGRRLFIGWMSNWQYAQKVPTERWRSAMTLPRELVLSNEKNHFEVKSIPVKELVNIRDHTLVLEERMIYGMNEIKRKSDDLNGLMELKLRFKIPDGPFHPPVSEFGVIFRNESGQKLAIGYNAISGEVFCDRSKSGLTGFSDNFSGTHTMPYSLMDSGEISLHLYLDKSSMELFIDGGKRVMTEIFFPDEELTSIFLYANDGTVELSGGIVYQLKSIW